MLFKKLKDWTILKPELERRPGRSVEAAVSVSKRKQDVRRTAPCPMDCCPGQAEEETMAGVETTHNENYISTRNTEHIVSPFLRSLYR